MDPASVSLQQILHDLGVDAATVGPVELLSQRHGHVVWRIGTPQRSYILKWLPEAEASTEAEGYLLLQALGVPTAQLYGYSARALLLEDLAWSDEWRLATAADLARVEAGRAVARWYRVFHNAGEALLAQGNCPGFLRRETDELDADGILATGRALGLSQNPVWSLAAEHVELLKATVAKLSVTLNYNDFYWTNLALSRGEGSRPEAIIFDYHLLGVGMRYSDCRNVTGSLSDGAVRAFWQTYGDVDAREEKLDRPLATLHNLVMAARLPGWPQWADSSRERVLSGALERDLVAALALAPGQCEATA